MRSLVSAAWLSLVPVVSFAQGEACPYRSAELATSLGMTFSEGQASETPYPGGKMFTCTYKAARGIELQVTQVRAASRSDAQQVAKGLQGSPIASDPDGAIWVNVVGDSMQVSLSYVRATTHTQVSVLGVNSRKPAEADPVREKLAKLRRVP